jgi:hypothetical protein
VRIEWVVLRLDPGALSAVAPAGEALGDEALDAARLGGREEVLRALRPQSVREGEPAIEVPEVGRAGEGRHLVDDRIRFRSGHRLADCNGIQAVHDDWFRAHRPDGINGRLARRRSGHVVATSDQHRHESFSNGAVRACNKDPHGWGLLSRLCTQDEMGDPGVKVHYKRPSPLAWDGLA